VVTVRAQLLERFLSKVLRVLGVPVHYGWEFVATCLSPPEPATTGSDAAMQPTSLAGLFTSRLVNKSDSKRGSTPGAAVQACSALRQSTEQPARDGDTPVWQQSVFDVVIGADGLHSAVRKDVARLTSTCNRSEAFHPAGAAVAGTPDTCISYSLYSAPGLVSFDASFIADSVNSLRSQSPWPVSALARSFHLPGVASEFGDLASALITPAEAPQQVTVIVNFKAEANSSTGCPATRSHLRASPAVPLDPWTVAVAVPGVQAVFKRFYQGHCHMQLLLRPEVIAPVERT